MKVNCRPQDPTLSTRRGGHQKGYDSAEGKTGNWIEVDRRPAKQYARPNFASIDVKINEEASLMDGSCVARRGKYRPHPSHDGVLRIIDEIVDTWNVSVP